MEDAAPESTCPLSCAVTQDQVTAFQRDGFLVHSRSIFVSPDKDIPELHHLLEQAINGDGECQAYKVNKVPQKYFSNGRFSFAWKPPKAPMDEREKAAKTIHLINVHQGVPMFRDLVLSEALAACVVALMGWEAHGCRVAQDQVWVKPPRSGPLTYHRDTPYIDFDPKEVCTAWIPLDEVQSERVGTLEYCAGSHRWATGRRGSANQFYDSDYKALLHSAAELESLGHGNAASPSPLRIAKVFGERGCCSFHDGSTWHGSAPNVTDGWRRGIGIHFVRGDAVLAGDAGKLWRGLLDAHEGDFNRAFPLVCAPQ